MEKPAKKAVVAVSGGPDSVYLLLAMKSKRAEVVVAHLNHAGRGIASDEDQRFVERLGSLWGFTVVCGRMPREGSGQHRPGRPRDRLAVGSEAAMRESRYRFLQSVRKEFEAETILVAHTADDQVETILMRLLEGAGVSGLKGIPRKGRDGIERPLLEMWREDVIKELRRHKIPYRVDQSNLDTRFERNWVRHELIPMLERRYGKSVKKRIFTLGERFREIDELLEDVSRKWLQRNVILEVGERTEMHGQPGRPARASARVPRSRYSELAVAVRKKVLQLLSFERAGVAPNERLLESMDRAILSGGPSAKLAIGKGAILSLRYGEAVLRPGPLERGPGTAGARGREAADRRKEPGREGAIVRLHGPGRYPIAWRKGEPGGAAAGLFPWIQWEEKGGTPAAGAGKLAAADNAVHFSQEDLLLPLEIRPLRAGDRIQPFGLGAEKKVKEVLIDRKVPREERWGRPVVCDARGRILWIPGVLRSAHAPVSAATRRTVVLRAGSPGKAVRPPVGGALARKSGSPGRSRR